MLVKLSSNKSKGKILVKIRAGMEIKYIGNSLCAQFYSPETSLMLFGMHTFEELTTQYASCFSLLYFLGRLDMYVQAPPSRQQSET